MMQRDEALKIFARHVTDEIVVAVYAACFDWMAICPRDLNYVSTGAMGQASSHALGLALGRPDKRVLVFDGDGSLMMNLGSLITIADMAPANLVHFVFENGCYEVNGAHPLPGTGRVDFCGFARAAGYRSVQNFDDLATFERAIPRLLSASGPAFTTLKVVPGAPYPRDYQRIHSAAMRENFRRALRGDHLSMAK
jgi:phosphonopyruvate decarboxylase